MEILNSTLNNRSTHFDVSNRSLDAAYAIQALIVTALALSVFALTVVTFLYQLMNKGIDAIVKSSSCRIPKQREALRAEYLRNSNSHSLRNSRVRCYIR